MADDSAERLRRLGGKSVVIGSGISSRERISLDPGEALPNSVDEIAALASETHGWAHQQAAAIEWLEHAWPLFSNCPAGGPRADRCCGAPSWPAKPGEDVPPTCRGPTWREREDLEWYVGEAQLLLSQIISMIKGGNADLAASYAVDLGRILAEAQFKDRWEKPALMGQRSIESLPHPRHPSSEIERVEEALRQEQLNIQRYGKPRKALAYENAAKALTERHGVPIGKDAIRASVSRGKKE